jgi:hypothetical protein
MGWQINLNCTHCIFIQTIYCIFSFNCTVKICIFKELYDFYKEFQLLSESLGPIYTFFNQCRDEYWFLMSVAPYFCAAVKRYFEHERPGRAILILKLWSQRSRRITLLMSVVQWLCYGYCCVSPCVIFTDNLHDKRHIIIVTKFAVISHLPLS